MGLTMTSYHPDNWVVLKIEIEGNRCYKVLAGWTSKTAYQQWRINSGIVSCKQNTTDYVFAGSSSSSYTCSNSSYGISKETAEVYNKLLLQYRDIVTVMPADTNWLTIDWDL